jgi:hypothetical protein
MSAFVVRYESLIAAVLNMKIFGSLKVLPDKHSAAFMV